MLRTSQPHWCFLSRQLSPNLHRRPTHRERRDHPHRWGRAPLLPLQECREPSHKGKGEKKLKGCILSQGGSYVLQEKSGKIVALTGADLSAHVGHEVAVHGSWEGGAVSSSTASSGGGMGSSDKARKQLNVDRVDMVSESCVRG